MIYDVLYSMTSKLTVFRPGVMLILSKISRVARRPSLKFAIESYITLVYRMHNNVCHMSMF